MPDTPETPYNAFFTNTPLTQMAVASPKKEQVMPANMGTSAPVAKAKDKDKEKESA